MMMRSNLLLVISAFLVFGIATTTTAWPNEFVPDTDLQDGFELGMAPEIQGLWLGDEKWKLDGVVENYCSRAIFYPEGYLTWESVPNSTCRDAGAYPKTKRVQGKWFEKIEMPGYLYRFRQKQCLPASQCQEDITKIDDPNDRDKFRDWTLEAKSCGAHLKDDQRYENTYTCESYMVSLISRELDDDDSDSTNVAVGRTNGNKKKKEYLLVSTLSYHFFYDGWDNYKCPSAGPSFLAKNIEESEDGSARFVLQSPFNSTAIYNPCEWDCFDDSMNDMFDCSSK